MFFSKKPKWHEGEHWEKVLKLYDSIAKEQFSQLEEYATHSIPTKYGDTYVHVCGPIDKPPIVMFHGISACSLMFGDWLVPEYCKSYRVFAIDTLGDLGRSRPKDGDPANCPQTEEQVAEWAAQVLGGLKIDKKVRVVGYSLGAYIGMCLAKHCPTKVEKIALVAPAGVVASVRLTWLAGVIMYGLILTLVPKESAWADTLRHNMIGSMMSDPSNATKMPRPEYRKAAESVGPSQVGMRPAVFDVETLAQIHQTTPILLLIGAEETVIDPKIAVSNGTNAGIDIKVFEKGGHLLYCESPRDNVTKAIETFFSL